MKKSAFYQSQQGQVRHVLIEGKIENNRLSGYTDNYVRVEVPYHPSLENAVAQIRIGDFNGETCDGEVLSIDSASTPIEVELSVFSSISR